MVIEFVLQIVDLYFLINKAFKILISYVFVFNFSNKFQKI